MKEGFGLVLRLTIIKEVSITICITCADNHFFQNRATFIARQVDAIVMCILILSGLLLLVLKVQQDIHI
jgi:hypothetical protein